MAAVKDFRFKHSSSGYKKIMKGSPVRADLLARARRVKSVADSQLLGEDIQIIADTNTGRTRSGATVIGVPMRLESTRRILGSAIDAAGG